MLHLSVRATSLALAAAMSYRGRFLRTVFARSERVHHGFLRSRHASYGWWFFRSVAKVLPVMTRGQILKGHESVQTRSASLSTKKKILYPPTAG